MRRTSLVVVALLTVIAGAMPPARAGSRLSYSTAPQFQTGINTGLITGISPTVVYTNPAPLNGLVAVNSNLSATLVACRINWPTDPDLTPSALFLETFLPQIVTTAGTSGINALQITLNDASNIARQWEFTNLALGANTFAFAFAQGAGAGGATSFTPGAGFDLTSVVSMDISVTLTTTGPPGAGSFTPLPSGNPPGTMDGDPWFGITRLEVLDIPEPGTLLLFALAGAPAAGWMTARRRRR